MPSAIVPLVLRVPQWMRDWIEREAQKEDRSMNQQVIHTLKQCAPHPPKDRTDESR